MAAAKTIQHPTFGPCELVPSIAAIRWRQRREAKAAAAALAQHGLGLATDAPRGAEVSGAARDPRARPVNQNETLSWVTGAGVTEDALGRASADGNVAWVGRVYRATAAEPGPQSYFAINPTVLILSPETAAAIGDLTAIDDAITIDAERGRRLKGLVVLALGHANALEVGERISAAARAKGVTPGVSLENVPYLAPMCGDCGCGREDDEHAGACAPSTAPVIPDDPFFPKQWGLQRINAPSAWPISEGDPNVVIAVLDQGVELAHPDLNLSPISYSTVTHLVGDGGPVGNHGTACAGIIGGKIENALGVSGVAGRCQVMAIATNFADTEVAEGLYFAADNGARVVSMSFGVYPSWMMWNFAIIEAALQYCHDRNVILVAASGNENQAISRFPGSDPRTICVGGSNRDDVRKSIGDTSIESWWGACYGPDVDVVAPCLEIPTTDRLGAAGYTPTDYDLRFNGTSSATPHVAGLAGLIISVDPTVGQRDVRRIISATADKIGAGTYAYLATPGKPFGTWNAEVGYGRINAERALLVACEERERKDVACCGVPLPVPDSCCVSPCDPPWRPDTHCMTWYESRFVRLPFGERREVAGGKAAARGSYVEVRVTYQHRLCLLGKQHGPLLYTVTLLPGEKVTLYHSDRYRRITTEQSRFTVQTTFSQFLSVVHQARVTETLDALQERLTKVHASGSSSAGTGFFGSLFGPDLSASISTDVSSSDHTRLQVSHVAEQFNQSVVQASQLTHAERSLVVSTYEDKEVQDITSRVIQNTNDCRAVTYFVRQVVELYAVSTFMSDVSYRVVTAGVASEWHTVQDLSWVPASVQAQVKAALKLLPRVGEVVELPRPVSIPTDGAVYNPELAHCGSCEPERAAAVRIRLEREKADARRACLEVQLLEVELRRRQLLLQRGDLATTSSGGSA